MTTDIDAGLHRLSAADHPGLATIEDAVLARVRARRHAEAAIGAPFVAVAALVAITLGTTAGAFSPAPAAASSLSPLGPSSPLAPSTLLASDR